jgi:hypothetical protein
MLIITIVSILLALVMGVVAWRATHAERERSAARVDALARDIHGVPEAPVQPRTAIIADEWPLRPAAASAEGAGPADMFAVAAQGTRSGSRWGLALAVGAFAVASAAALIVVLGGEGPGTRVALASERGGTLSRPAETREVPLELTTLSHERDGNQLTVRGVVRNPAAGTEMDHLSAVVVLFDGDGHVVTTGRSALGSSALIPGGESPFAVTIANAADTARYRVSFRSGERVVSHIDKRAAP